MSLLFTCFHYRRNIKDCFKINGKQTIKMPKKGEYVKFKNFERKIKSPLMIYADFESILAPEDNGKQNPNINKYQKLLLVYIKKTISKSLKSIYSYITKFFVNTSHRQVKNGIKS